MNDPPSSTMDGPYLGSNGRDGSIEVNGDLLRPHANPYRHFPVRFEVYAAFGQLEQWAARFLASRSLLAFSLAFANSTTTSSPVPVYNSSGV